jgi:hypothetical protein
MRFLMLLWREADLIHDVRNLCKANIRTVKL